MINAMREIWDESRHEDVVNRWVNRCLFVIGPCLALVMLAVVGWMWWRLTP